MTAPAFALLVTVVAAAQTDPAVRMTADRGEMTVGDRLTLTVTVDHDRETTVAWPDSVSFAPFELIARRAMPARAEGERMRSVAEFVVTAFELGELTVPAISVTVSGVEEPLATDPLDVTVRSVGLDEEGDIRDIRGPRAIPLNWAIPLAWVMGIGLIVAAAVWWYRRRRARRPGVVPYIDVTPERPPHEIAYEALAALEGDGLIERGAVKEYFIRVSEIVRVYLDGRFGIDAMEMTTGDVLAALTDVVESDDREPLAGFLARSDLVKFAKLVPDASACREMIPLARAFVDATREREPEPADDAAALAGSEAGVP